MTCEMIQFHDACYCVKEGIFQKMTCVMICFCDECPREEVLGSTTHCVLCLYRGSGGSVGHE